MCVSEVQSGAAITGRLCLAAGRAELKAVSTSLHSHMLMPLTLRE